MLLVVRMVIATRKSRSQIGNDHATPHVRFDAQHLDALGEELSSFARRSVPLSTSSSPTRHGRRSSMHKMIRWLAMRSRICRGYGKGSELIQAAEGGRNEREEREERGM